MERPQSCLLAPRPNLVDAALRLAAETAQQPLGRTRIIWSAAELAYPELATQSVNATGGTGVFAEKILLDAYRPMNAILSLAIAGFAALANEAIRTDKIEELVKYIDGENDDEEQGSFEPWDWSLVGINTSTAFARETVGLTMLRGIEKAAKARLEGNSYREVIKNTPKLSRHVYQAECVACGRKWSAAASASKVVLRSVTFYGLRSLTCLAADVLVDSVQMLRGKLSQRNFKTNALLKAYKYTLSAAFCLSLGVLVPFVHTHPWMFMLSDLLGGLGADTLVSFVGYIDPADGRSKK